MEAGTTPAQGTGSSTIADLCAAAAARTATRSRSAQGRRRPGVTSPSPRSARSSSEIGLGLIALGLEPGERVASCATRAPSGPTRTSRSRRPAASSCRSTRRTRPRSASGWPATRSRSSSSARTPSRWPRSSPSAIACRALRTIVVIDPPATWPTRSRSTTCASAAAARDARRAAERTRGRQARTTRSPSSTPRARPGPPKGCVLTHGNYRSVLDMVERARARSSGEDLTYLFLPLAHAFALLIQLGASTSARRSPTTAATPRRSSPSSWRSSRPTCRRCRASSRSSTRSPQPAARRPEQLDAGRELGVQSRTSRSAARRSRGAARPVRAADEQLFANVRAIFGGRARRPSPAPRRSPARSSSSSAAAACPVLEGYGMTETSTVGDRTRARGPRFGTVGRRCPGVEVRIADDGELPDQGRQHLPAATTRTTTRRSAPSRTAGCTPATSARSTRTATSRSPAARRTSSSPPAARTSRRPTSRTT